MQAKAPAHIVPQPAPKAKAKPKAKADPAVQDWIEGIVKMVAVSQRPLYINTVNTLARERPPLGLGRSKCQQHLVKALNTDPRLYQGLNEKGQRFWAAATLKAELGPTIAVSVPAKALRTSATSTAAAAAVRVVSTRDDTARGFEPEGRLAPPEVAVTVAVADTTKDIVTYSQLTTEDNEYLYTMPALQHQQTTTSFGELTSAPVMVDSVASSTPPDAAGIEHGDGDDDEDNNCSAFVRRPRRQPRPSRHHRSALEDHTAAALEERGPVRGFLLASRSARALEAGVTLADRNTAAYFAEAALLGERTTAAGHLADPASSEVYLNTHEPFCFATVGVQGGGKSHTMACVLESCLVPMLEDDVVRLHAPMSALVLHYDQNVTSVCEATGLVSPHPALQRILTARAAASASTSASATSPPGLPRDKMVVLVSPSFYRQRKAFYGDYCTVKPLLFRWPTLTADHIKRIMRIKDGDNQLYVAAMLDLLRRYQRDAVVPAFGDFIAQVKKTCQLNAQRGPLEQRMALLESLVAESAINASIRAEGGDLYSSCQPGTLVIADLTDPLLAAEEANGIFQVLTEQYRALPLRGCGKLLALDEAHKFMDGVAGDGLSEAIVAVARLMRHDGMRLAVSTQSPLALAPELLELVTVAVLHRFHSRDWFSYLAKKLPLSDRAALELATLQPGHALAFASRTHMLGDGSPAGYDDGADGLGINVFPLRVRGRITADRGASRRNTTAAAVPSPDATSLPDS